MTCLSPSQGQLLAQRINNSAASCIEMGQYSKAIISLKKALEMNKKDNNKKSSIWSYREKSCKCYHCTLDGCITFSESNSSITSVQGSTISSRGGWTRKRRKILSSRTLARRTVFWRPPRNESNRAATTKIQEDLEQDDLDCGYIYRQPIRVPCEGHVMGSTIFLIIVFNLALARHLEAVDCVHSKREQHKLVGKTLSLYQLAYSWQLKLLRKNNTKVTKNRHSKPFAYCSSVRSIRFNMIILSNLSQIHRLVNDYQKYKRCLQYLLSTVMVVVEYNSRNSTRSHGRRTTPEDPRAMNLNGFLQNATPVILDDDQCAQAA
eukprot:jgi/Psemu1/208843/e_gw1.481.21.1